MPAPFQTDAAHPGFADDEVDVTAKQADDTESSGIAHGAAVHEHTNYVITYDLGAYKMCIINKPEHKLRSVQWELVYQ